MPFAFGASLFPLPAHGRQFPCLKRHSRNNRAPAAGASALSLTQGLDSSYWTLGTVYFLNLRLRCDVDIRRFCGAIVLFVLCALFVCRARPRRKTPDARS